MRRCVPVRAAVAVLFFAVAALAGGPEGASADIRAKLPRFATVRADEVNVRTGPGVRYPVEWVFVYRNMPVEIIAQFDTWRKIRDWEGTEGWVHQSMLSGRRSVIVTGGEQPMRRVGDLSGKLVAKVEERVVGRLLDCADAWCRVEIAGLRGWMQRDHLWGVGRDDSPN